MNRQTLPCALILLGLALAAACSISPTMPGEYFVYTTVSGDTVSQIATRYHVSIEQIINLNKNNYPDLARDPSKIQAGWKLLLPKITAQATVDPTQTDPNQAALLVIEGINNARAQKGLVLLRYDAGLARIANDRSADMIARDYFSH